MAHKLLARVEAIYRYPVKGLSAQRLQSVALSPGQPVPFDRAWAIQDERGRFDPAAPKYLPKVNFLMLMRHETLAELETEFDEDGLHLTIRHQGEEVARGDLSTTEGRSEIERFFGAHMAESIQGTPRIVSSQGFSFSDVSEKCLHIINRASLVELEGVVGRALDPLRFRPNLVVDGWPAWCELKFVGQRISVGGVQLEVFKRTERCAATNVDPSSGTRDMTIPDLLRQKFGHTDFGIYAKVVSPGHIACGDQVVA